jgi:glycosyltransferase involved in cell wall biosynthesis
MKILLIAPQPFFAVRGTPLAVKELITVFSKHGHEVDLLTFHLGEDISLPGLKIYRNRLLKKIIPSLRPGFSWGKLILDNLLIFRVLYMIIKHNYQAVHCIEESSFFVAWMKWLKPFIFVYDMDSDIPRQLEESKKIKSRFLLKLAGIMERYALKKSDAVVTIGPVYTGRIKKEYPGKPVFQIEDVSASDTIKASEKSSNKKIILYTGNFEKYQGVELLIQAFTEMEHNRNDITLMLVGGEEKEARDFGEKYSCHNIVFTGKKLFDEMPGFLEKADILVSPRISGENTPFKIYSYLACGKPLLATDITSHSQILTSEQNALLVEPTAEGIKKGLNRILDDKKLSGKISSGAKKLFDENYTRSCYERKVLNYIKFLEERSCQKKK